MIQLDLFEDEGPQPVQRWLYVWTEAERAKKCPTREAQGECRANPARETADEAVCQRTTRPSCAGLFCPAKRANRP